MRERNEFEVNRVLKKSGWTNKYLRGNGKVFGQFFVWEKINPSFPSFSKQSRSFFSKIYLNTKNFLGSLNQKLLNFKCNQNSIYFSVIN